MRHYKHFIKYMKKNFFRKQRIIFFGFFIFFIFLGYFAYNLVYSSRAANINETNGCPNTVNKDGSINYLPIGSEVAGYCCYEAGTGPKSYLGNSYWAKGKCSNNEESVEVEEVVMTPTSIPAGRRTNNRLMDDPSKSNEINVLVLGDSFSFPEIYQKEIERSSRLSRNRIKITTDAAIGRGTADLKYDLTGGGILYRLNHEPSLKDLSGYDYAIVFAGVNDFNNNGNFGTKINLKDIYLILKNQGLKVIAITVLPFKTYTGFTWNNNIKWALDDLNDWILSKEAGVDCAVDAFSQFESDSGSYSLRPSCSTGDNLHLNENCLIELGQLIYESCF